MKKVIYAGLVVVSILLCSICVGAILNRKTDAGQSLETSPIVSIPIEFKPIATTEAIFSTTPESKPIINWSEQDGLEFPKLTDLVVDADSGYASTPFIVKLDDVYQYLNSDKFLSSQYPVISKGREESITYHNDTPAVYYTDKIVCTSDDMLKSLIISFERDAAQYANYHKITVQFEGLTENITQEHVRDILEKVVKNCADYATFSKDPDGKSYQYTNKAKSQNDNLIKLGTYGLSESTAKDGYKYYIVRQFNETNDKLLFCLGVERDVDVVIPDAPILVGNTLNEFPMDLEEIVSADFGITDPTDTTHFANKLISRYDENYSHSVIEKVIVERISFPEYEEYNLYINFGYFKNEQSRAAAKFELAMWYTADKSSKVIDADFGAVISGLEDKSFDKEDQSNIRVLEFEEIISLVEGLFAYPNASNMHYIDGVPTVVNKFYANILGQAYQQNVYVDYIAGGAITIRCNRDLITACSRCDS